MLLNHHVKIFYYLTIFESEMGELIPQDLFNLKHMSKLFSENIKTLKLEKALERSQTLELRRISDKEVKSKHVVICAAGFLQEDDDFNAMWGSVLKTYRHSEVFAMVWTSCTLNEFFEKGSVKEQKQVTAMKKFLHACNIYITGFRQFVFAEDQARLTGAMLALFLLKSKFFKGRAVTLVGYSLGTQVAMACIKTLKHFHRDGNTYAG
jgi:hypothetical protein